MNLYLVLLLSVLSAVHCQDPVEEEVIVSHHSQALGGWNEVDPKQNDVKEASKIALERFNEKPKAKKYFKLVNIISAETKVTNMIDYKISAVIGRTKCLKTDPGDLDSCDMSQKRFKCKFEVQFNPRDDQYVVNVMSCNKISRKSI